MAVVNQYKFYGVTLTTTDETTMFGASSPLATETYIIKSFRVTNNTGNTPTITIKNNAFAIENAKSLSANASVEILTLPLIVEGSTLLKVTMNSSDSVTIGISYLNIKKEVTT